MGLWCNALRLTVTAWRPCPKWIPTSSAPSVPTSGAAGVTKIGMKASGVNHDHLCRACKAHTNHYMLKGMHLPSSGPKCCYQWCCWCHQDWHEGIRYKPRLHIVLQRRTLCRQASYKGSLNVYKAMSLTSSVLHLHMLGWIYAP